MSKIQFGEYTIFKGQEMAISEMYGHGLSQNIEENYRILSYSKKFPQIAGFQIDIDTGRFVKRVLLNELDNAFLVVSRIKYKDETFDLEPNLIKSNTFQITTKNKDLGIAWGFYTLHDSLGQIYYIKEIDKSQVQSAWEEIRDSSYDLPMPVGIEKVRFIDI